MAKRLYVGNLSYSTTDQRLREMFAQYGEVTSAELILDRMTGQSRGFGFVEMATPADATRAIEAMHGAELDGRSRVVNEARERSGGGGGGGGFGGGGGGG
ncbi:MAG: RNA-binding protein, partial [Polyangiaceae bacterium]|nr:RNA-binding protein [Polyangiaceae bacterium]